MLLLVSFCQLLYSRMCVNFAAVFATTDNYVVVKTVNSFMCVGLCYIMSICLFVISLRGNSKSSRWIFTKLGMLRGICSTLAVINYS